MWNHLAGGTALSSRSSPAAAEDDILSRGLESLSLQDVEGVTPRLGEALIAHQLNKLSTNERERVILDIHGVAEIVDETPELLHESLIKMQHAVDTKLLTLRRQQRPQIGFHGERADEDVDGHGTVQTRRQHHPSCAYERALAMLDQDIVTPSAAQIDIRSHEFKLSFLRAERFQPKAAAERMLRYFAEKERLFGADFLTRDVRMKDLDNESLECLECGRIQLPAKDIQGRAIMIGLRKLVRKISNMDSLLRAFWYLCSVASEDIDTQKRGMVFILYSLGTTFASRTQIHSLGRVLQVLPVRAASFHACCDDAVTIAAATIASLLIGVNNTMRVRCHSGSDLEVQYNLMTFGIPTNLLPVSKTGEVSVNQHLKFLEERRHAESLEEYMEGGDDIFDAFVDTEDVNTVAGMEADAMASLQTKEPTRSDTSSEVVLPSTVDVISGRGKGLQDHEGNLRYRAIVERYRHTYETTTEKGGKGKIIIAVVQEINASGGRFLKQDSKGRWIVLDDEQTEDKVSHSFRNQKRLSHKAAPEEACHEDIPGADSRGSNQKRRRS